VQNGIGTCLKVPPQAIKVITHYGAWNLGFLKKGLFLINALILNFMLRFRPGGVQSPSRVQDEFWSFEGVCFRQVFAFLLPCRGLASW